MRAEEEDLAVLISNLKTRTPKRDPLKVARSCRRLRHLYGSYEKLSAKVGLDSHEMLREFEALLSLPAEVKSLYKKGILKSVVAGYWISRMKRSDEDKRQLANAVVQYKLTARDVRDAVAYAQRRRDYSIQKVISAITGSKKAEPHYLVVVKLQGTTLQRLEKIAGEQKVEPESLLRRAIATIVRPRDLLLLAVDGNIVTMRLNERGFRTMQTRANATGMQLEGLIDNITGRWLRSSLA